MGDVSHGSRQVRVEQRHAEARDSRRQAPPEHTLAQQHHRHARSADPHAQHVGPITADVVGKPPGEQLRATPDEAIDANDPADIRQTESLTVKEQRVEDPDQRIDELLDQPRLAERSQPAVAPGHEGEDFPAARLRRYIARIARHGLRACSL
ncbi:hypothetical protein D3C78_1446970 [compost metagenome]